nr:MAG TPA: hypothetical protein [Caudoviricetes sp.]
MGIQVRHTSFKFTKQLITIFPIIFFTLFHYICKLITS